MPQYYQLSKPRINLGPAATAHVDYAKYWLKILALLKFVRFSNGIHTNAYSFFLKKGNRVLKKKLRTLRFVYTVGLKIHTRKNYIIVNTINF